MRHGDMWHIEELPSRCRDPQW